MYKSSFDLLVSGLSEYISSLEIVLDILDKVIHDFPKVCGYFKVIEMYIKPASFIICLINYKLTNTSSTTPPKLKKKQYSGKKLLFIATVLWNFLPVLISLLGNWSI